LKKLWAVGGGFLVIVILGMLLAQKQEVLLSKFVPPLVGGFFSGWLAREKGWLWGGLSAVLGLVLVEIILSLLSVSREGIFFISLRGASLFLAIGIIGGILGEYGFNTLHKK